MDFNVTSIFHTHFEVANENSKESQMMQGNELFLGNTFLLEEHYNYFDVTQTQFHS